MPQLDWKTRRAFLMSASSIALVSPALSAYVPPTVVVHRDPSCVCCGNWIDYLRQSGFSVEVRETAYLQRIRTRLGVPIALAACHTGEVEGYVIEGHVPVPAIRRLLTEKPTATGLAVPGMPAGSPGMEVEGAEPKAFDVILFGPSSQRAFGRYRGSIEI
ncbi:DUF411 domain-containing protein [Roseiarcaceae bacterium H3SJ34-1]|uniref:DUF411 domain-containing protein n=1 Tax=Terripilifer ovatus TaxID=3032367 RepID=UPI003AB98CAD|nr:DUF411 domain-containing protein [Roseiarcaceae bacterium H3SJ34-1]